MSKTNSLGSHHGESTAFRADKLLPKSLKKFKVKDFLKRKNRLFLKNDLHNQITNLDYQPKI